MSVLCEDTSLHENLRSIRWKDFFVLKYLLRLPQSDPQILELKDIHQGLRDYIVTESSSLM